jgi:hypothetical protein
VVIPAAVTITASPIANCFRNMTNPTVRGSRTISVHCRIDKTVLSGI